MLEVKLSRFIGQHARDMKGEFLEVKVWAFVTAAVLQPPDRRSTIFEGLIRVGKELIEFSPRKAVELAREMIWIDIVESPNVEGVLEDMELGTYQVGGLDGA